MLTNRFYFLSSSLFFLPRLWSVYIYWSLSPLLFLHLSIVYGKCLLENAFPVPFSITLLLPCVPYTLTGPVLLRTFYKAIRTLPSFAQHLRKSSSCKAFHIAATHLQCMCGELSHRPSNWVAFFLHEYPPHSYSVNFFDLCRQWPPVAANGRPAKSRNFRRSLAEWHIAACWT